ncbi:hypothetical protein [Bradyrhizobium agreste]|uniref:hypothetical protein n=1 Tax=Bradyrhizobium agreste TaxID=2751811 RepID=UPI0035DC89D9
MPGAVPVTSSQALKNTTLTFGLAPATGPRSRAHVHGSQCASTPANLQSCGKKPGPAILTH